ncbi:hypothetical protein HDA32_006069 [Spinactinospora alkalitolerans]|uniref:Uncharacterized protein n=1 Tax=Spinactinospora alkalitolerans TaxID=687207 RepID=A0A852U430_9ACTN|nr:hypothetical protein [Spinactinospora alkalitolerans]NYE50949.1 hypothetical protein [Spinactinospora alkalitolerans]
MSRVLFLLLLPVALLLAVASPRPPGAHRAAIAVPTSPAVAPCPAAPMKPPCRQARSLPRRIPDYCAFAAMALRNEARWEITYEHDSPAPCTARHRANGDVIATADPELLDELLRAYDPAPAARRYLDAVNA